MKKNRKIPIIIPMLFLLVSALFCLTGCGDDEKGDYSGVGQLIADRNKARMSKASSGSQDASDLDSAPPQDTMGSGQVSETPLSGMTFEEPVRIVSETTGQTIATATAYLDKSGRIVNIRIRKSR
ncbi:MAG: hypothetical protein HQK66_02105 [Desulfamplus sp.]|nr:hypothetical protein [Desulfamplus sp.]